MAKSRLCSVFDCNKAHKGHGYCAMHLHRFKARGTVDKHIPTPHARNWIYDHSDYSENHCLIWPFHRMENGYGQVYDGVKLQVASRFMCSVAHGNPHNDQLQAAHSCGNGNLGCVNPKHLSWKTPSENETDKFQHGTKHHGETAPQAVLTESDVRAIRDNNTASYAHLSRVYGVSNSTIWDVIRRRTWKHI